MADNSKKVFISYRRRLAAYFARAIYLDLDSRGFDVFMDVENLDAGAFPQRILHQIEARPHFVICLTPGSLSGMEHDGDWLRKESDHALHHDRSVVPMLGQGSVFDDPEERQVLDALPDRLRQFEDYQAVRVYDDYVDAGLERLRTRFLTVEVAAEVAPTPPDEREWEQNTRDEASAAARRTRPQAATPELADRPVFIIHDAADRAFADRVASFLEKNGITTWLDREELRGGAEWDAMIEKTLRDEARYVVVLQSAALKAQGEGYVNKEISIALDNALYFRGEAVYLIPAFIDSPNNGLDELKRYQWIDLTGDVGLYELVKVIKRDKARSR